MKHQLEQVLTDLVTHLLQGHQVDAYVKYYHKNAWLLKQKPLPSYVNGYAGEQALQYINNNKCLSAEKVLKVGARSDISYINWVYSGTE